MVKGIVQIIVGMLITGFIASIFILFYDWIAYGNGYDLILLGSILVGFVITSFILGGTVIEEFKRRWHE